MAVIELDGALVRLAAVDGVNVSLAFQFMSPSGRGDGKRKEQQEGEEDDDEENDAGFRIALGAAVREL